MQKDSRSKPDVSPPSDKRPTRPAVVVKTLILVYRLVRLGRWLDEKLGISELMADL